MVRGSELRRTSLLPLVVMAWACASGSKAPEAAREVAVVPPLATLAPSGHQSFSALVNGSAGWTVEWSVREGSAGGSIGAAGDYTAPANEGLYHVVATEPGSRLSAEAAVTVSSACWSLPAVDRARLFPRAGSEADMIGGTVQGSNESATNGFVTLYTLTDVQQGWNEVVFSGSPYRWVKYMGPGSPSLGTVAEVRFYEGATEVTGLTFGTPGALPDHTYVAAFDGDPVTYYEGTSSVSNYVGLDLADGHVVATPIIDPNGGQVPQASVTLSTATPGATILYTTSGADPAASGTTYTGPFPMSGPGVVRAIATKGCMYRSAIATATFTQGSALDQRIALVGNSLTDTVRDRLDPVAAQGGFNFTVDGFTVPGAGTYVYQNDGGGVQAAIAGTRYDHVTFQPAANMPCIPAGHAELGTGVNGTDGNNIQDAWADSRSASPSARFWVYATWLAPASSEWSNCLTGVWNRELDYAAHDHVANGFPIWQPNRAVDAATWVLATTTQLRYAERVRSWLAWAHPTWPEPHVIPGGLALVNLRAAWLAGRIPGVTTTETAFFNRLFGDTSADDHLVADGEYFLTVLFYAMMTGSDPVSLPDTSLGSGVTWTSAQAAAVQQVVAETVASYSEP